MSSTTLGGGNYVPEVDWEAIGRYLAGESSAAERERIERWLAAQPADSRLIATLDAAVSRLALTDASTAGIDVEAALKQVNARRAAAPVLPRQAVRMLTGRRTLMWPTLAAAALVLAVGALVLRGRTSSEIAPVIAARDLTTPVGGRDSLVLPDGSQIVLGPGSHLTIAANYGLAAREVTLRGEAFFDVKHDASKPFTVMANGTTVRDVGTSFGVHADSTGGVRVAVVSGVVELRQTGSTAGTVLNATDVGTVSTDGSVNAKRGAGSDDDLAWQRGTLIFRDATLAEVRDDLRRWYGIQLTFRDSAVLGRHMTATFTDRDSAASVLNAIRLLLPATIERQGDTAMVLVGPPTTRRK
jgi:transmembrane sensor